MREREEIENLWGYAKRLRFVRDAIADAFPDREAESLRVLDVGCGNGSQLALPLVRAGFQVTGVDTDSRSIAHAIELADQAANARFICQAVEQLPDDERFEVVILSEVLEHTEQPSLMLAACVERMAADSILIVTVPNGFGEFEIDLWLFRSLHVQRLVDAIAKTREKALSSTDNEQSGHVQFFTRRRLHRLFRACALEVKQESGGSFLAGPLIGHFIAPHPRLVEWNARVTDKIPLALASSWYFLLRRTANGKTSA